MALWRLTTAWNLKRMASPFIHDNTSHTQILTLLLERCDDVLRMLSTRKTGGYICELSLSSFTDLNCKLDKLSLTFRRLRSIILGPFPSLAPEFASCEANFAIILNKNGRPYFFVSYFTSQIKKFKSTIKRTEKAYSLLAQSAKAHSGSTALIKPSERQDGLESPRWAPAAEQKN
jgi:hypothetical protein